MRPLPRPRLSRAACSIPASSGARRIPARAGKHNPLRWAAAAGLALGMVLAPLAGCSGDPVRPPSGPPPAQWSDAQRARAGELQTLLSARPRAAAGQVQVQLAFPADADLDLYVTDPRQETVYYANTPVRSGGALQEDRRCVHPAPRVETVRFEAPLAGTYRVGVDYPQACEQRAGAVAFAVSVEHGGQRSLHTGLIQPLVFEPIVLEFDAP